MLPKFVIAGLAVTAFVVTTALIPTDASAGGRSGPQPGTWNWPSYAEGPRTTSCVNSSGTSIAKPNTAPALRPQRPRSREHQTRHT